MEQALAELWAGLKQAGAAGGIIFGVLWWLERAERRELQGLIYGAGDKTGLLERFLVALGDTKDALKELRGLFNNSGK